MIYDILYIGNNYNATSKHINIAKNKYIRKLYVKYN